MQITMSNHENVAVMQIIGNLDASCYTDVIIQAQRTYDDGARNLLLDMDKVPYVSSAGLVALHTVVRIFMGHSVHSKDGGRPAFRSVNPQEDSAGRDRVKLLKPQPDVEQVLDVTGLKQFLQIFTDFNAAVRSFDLPAA